MYCISDRDRDALVRAIGLLREGKGMSLREQNIVRMGRLAAHRLERKGRIAAPKRGG